jgi:hypothetical protein
MQRQTDRSAVLWDVTRTVIISEKVVDLRAEA